MVKFTPDTYNEKMQRWLKEQEKIDEGFIPQPKRTPEEIAGRHISDLERAVCTVIAKLAKVENPQLVKWLKRLVRDPNFAEHWDPKCPEELSSDDRLQRNLMHHLYFLGAALVDHRLYGEEGHEITSYMGPLYLHSSLAVKFAEFVLTLNELLHTIVLESELQ